MESVCEYLCECNSFECRKTINMTPADEMGRARDTFAIANDCTVGPDPTDVLVEKREGFSWYREGVPTAAGSEHG